MEEERKIFEALFCAAVSQYRFSKLLVYAVKTPPGLIFLTCF